MIKIKVIDLLNKIANGEEVKFNVINKGFKTEYYYEKGKPLRYEDDEDVEWRISEDWLNCEVEIIEEDKKIEKLWFSLYEMERVNEEVLTKIENKINEIIDYLEEKENE